MSHDDSLATLIQERGPLTVAAFMDLALYHPAFGYYARAAQRSGRAGDFFTSVDVGTLFGELLEIQLAEMAALVTPDSPQPFDIVEAGAGNGRLSAGILRAARRHDRAFYETIRLHLVEASPRAREAQPASLGDVAERLVSSGEALPESFEGVLLANELLDALPVHQVVMRDDGLREVYVTGDRRLAEGPPSTPALADYLARGRITLKPGWRAEINLAALDWIRQAAERLRRGFIVLIDYGHAARDLYNDSHAGGTLTTFSRHVASTGEPAWLERPGEVDITAHVDFTSVQRAAEDSGLSTLGFLDQTYFLLGLVESDRRRDRLALAQAPGAGLDAQTMSRTSALKTLLMPGGLGSTHKVLILGKGVGKPALAGCGFRVRVT